MPYRYQRVGVLWMLGVRFLFLAKVDTLAWTRAALRTKGDIPVKTLTFLRSNGGRRFHASPRQDDNDFNTHNNEQSSFIATCVPGLSIVLAQELETLGCTAVETTGSGAAAVRFVADGPTALKCLIWARTPHKIMEFLVESPPTLQTREDLNQFVYDNVHVQSLLGNGQGGLLSLAVSTILNSPQQIPADINHSHFTALTIKNALCDAVRDLRGDRPDVNLANPDVPLVAVVRGTHDGAQFSLYRQIHGTSSLHKRGYRPNTIHKAALKESLAAGLLYRAQWDETCRQARNSGAPSPLLLDPMTGSGTLVLEAILMAADLAPHLMRIKTSSLEQEESAPALTAMHQLPPMLRWRDYADLRDDVWPTLLRQAAQRGKEGIQWLRENGGHARILVNDLHTGALSLLDESLANMDIDANLVDITAGDCVDWQPKVSHDSSDEQWTIVCNPPWGVRLEEDVEESWEALGQFLRHNCPPGRTTAWILSGQAEATRRLGLRRSSSMPVKVGTQDLRWLQYEIHELSETTKDARESRKPKVPQKVQHRHSHGKQEASQERRFRVKRDSQIADEVGESPRKSRERKPETRGRRPSGNKSKPKPKRARVPASDSNEWLID